MVSINDSYKQTNNDSGSGVSSDLQSNPNEKKGYFLFGDYSEDIKNCEENIADKRTEIKEHELMISIFSGKISENYHLMDEYKDLGDIENYKLAYNNYWSNRFSKVSENNAIWTCLSSIRTLTDSINHFTRMESFNGLIEKYLT